MQSAFIKTSVELKTKLVWSDAFRSYRIGPDSMQVHFHAHNGTELYVTPPILPRTKKQQPPLPPLPPFPAPPPAPKPPPTPPPAPPPPGTTWDCHPAMAVSASSLKLSDHDLTHGFKSITDCENTCNALSDCIAINWHESDLHCHVLGGKTTHNAFLKALSKGAKTATACMRVSK